MSTSSAAPGRQRSDSLARRLRDWLTPSHALAALGPLTAVQAGAQLDVFRIDSSTRQLLDPACCGYAFQVLRERDFPNRELSLAATDFCLLTTQSALLLSPLASARWLAAADRPLEQAGFSFLYQPFTLSLAGDCLLSGRVVPPASQRRQPFATIQPSIHAQRLVLRAVAGSDEEEGVGRALLGVI